MMQSKDVFLIIPEKLFLFIWMKIFVIFSVCCSVCRLIYILPRSSLSKNFASFRPRNPKIKISKSNYKSSIVVLHTMDRTCPENFIPIG